MLGMLKKDNTESSHEIEHGGSNREARVEVLGW